MDEKCAEVLIVINLMETFIITIIGLLEPICTANDSQLASFWENHTPETMHFDP